MKITRWTDNAVIYEDDGQTIKESLIRAVASRAVLAGAVLRGAVLTGADLRGADLAGAVLTGADLRGADLRDAVLSRAVLRGAVLSRAVLTGAVLAGAVLRGADLRDAVLSRAVLRGAVLSRAVLTGAVLAGAVLTGADLRGADLAGAPVVANLHSSMLAAIEAGGRLEMGSWHTCETTHCRAGWAITLAGEEGRKLEDAIGPAAAGALITIASCPWMERVPNFYASNEDALADIKACAEKEAPCTS